ncbi:hypothetical protein OCL06_14065 [Alteromonas sp. ASW11-19]|uniref:Uncharacterized protein n=1 Tax=Alteromonas salexigens TaxID=2982530 RepID=A0ABT2VS31_9ALTE|nr:hypothetical protein [Alteromonas salexigens]MCU7555713.1 hypothetical protein [Alteromonas salexigens]
MRYRVIVFCVSALFFSSSNAADRGHGPVEIIPSVTETKKRLPSGWQQQLQVGGILHHRVFEASEIVYRDPALGLLTIQLEDKFVRLVEATHEIVDIHDDF